MSQSRGFLAVISTAIGFVLLFLGTVALSTNVAYAAISPPVPT